MHLDVRLGGKYVDDLKPLFSDMSIICTDIGSVMALTFEAITLQPTNKRFDRCLHFGNAGRVLISPASCPLRMAHWATESRGTLAETSNPFTHVSHAMGHNFAEASGWVTQCHSASSSLTPRAIANAVSVGWRGNGDDPFTETSVVSMLGEAFALMDKGGHRTMPLPPPSSPAVRHGRPGETYQASHREFKLTDCGSEIGEAPVLGTGEGKGPLMRSGTSQINTSFN